MRRQDSIETHRTVWRHIGFPEQQDRPAVANHVHGSAMEHSLLKERERFKSCLTVHFVRRFLITDSRRPVLAVHNFSTVRFLCQAASQSSGLAGASGGLAAASGSSARECATSTPTSEVSAAPPHSLRAHETPLCCARPGKRAPTGGSSSLEKRQGRPGTVIHRRCDPDTELHRAPVVCPRRFRQLPSSGFAHRDLASSNWASSAPMSANVSIQVGRSQISAPRLTPARHRGHEGAVHPRDRRAASRAIQDGKCGNRPCLLRP